MALTPNEGFHEVRISARQLRLAAVASLIAVLSSCGHAATKLAIDDRATPTSTTMPTTTTTTVDKAAVTRWNRAVWNNAVWVNAVKHAEAVKSQVRAGVVVSQPRPAAVSVPTDIASIEACIKAHESGNYNEHSHAAGSSGAYQFERGTFDEWATRAGYPQYANGPAYLAPPAIQDAVAAYALQNGGAGAWSMRFGNDPCTSGLPGGG